ncbi:MAG TPA: HRDC domain-containing protein [Thermoanaerobaculia bacterium]|nr:HRDC domain-containing protein [Thermoanaerobaculia bacterium]
MPKRSELPEPVTPTPIEDAREVERLAAEIAAAGFFALDLEFVSESRYVPNLSLLQVGWGDPDSPEVALVDPLATDPLPIVDLVADPQVEVVLHSAQGDLALLAERFGIVGRAVWDSQVAAGFVGLGDQVGYGALVEQLTGVVLDKAAQFTNWSRRPLSDEQLHYAVDDVWYLPRLWRELVARLEAGGRLGWVAEESARVARVAARRPAPEEMFRRIRGWERLPPEARTAVRALAAWRERQALAGNRPPQWLLRDAVLLEVARRQPETVGELRGVRGIQENTVRRHGEAILAALAAGAEPPEAPQRGRRLPARVAGWGASLSGLIQERCRAVGIAPRFVASRADAEELLRWWVENRDGEPTGQGAAEPDLPLLAGWRREIAGQAALDWLADQTATDSDEGPIAGPPPGDGAATDEADDSGRRRDR